jgi:hypothetical protein
VGLLGRRVDLPAETIMLNAGFVVVFAEILPSLPRQSIQCFQATGK